MTADGRGRWTDVDASRERYMRWETGLIKGGRCAAKANAPGFGSLSQVGRQRRIGFGWVKDSPDWPGSTPAAGGACPEVKKLVSVNMRVYVGWEGGLLGGQVAGLGSGLGHNRLDLDNVLARLAGVGVFAGQGLRVRGNGKKRRSAERMGQKSAMPDEQATQDVLKARSKQVQSAVDAESSPQAQSAACPCLFPVALVARPVLRQHSAEARQDAWQRASCAPVLCFDLASLH